MFCLWVKENNLDSHDKFEERKESGEYKSAAHMVKLKTVS